MYHPQLLNWERRKQKSLKDASLIDLLEALGYEVQVVKRVS
jgi:hypothetical protein